MSITRIVYRQCPGCGVDLTHRTLYICHECWRVLPAGLRKGYNHSRTLDERREAYKEILRHFRDKKQQPELPL